MIDKATVQKIKDTADIVEVVSDYVHLVRRGANYMGLCPFHNERTPSFSVNKRKNFCFCFSCKKGGSPVNFIMEKEGLSYHDALLHLAKKYGIEVQEREMSDEERALQSQRESMLVANEWAMQKMEKDLFETEEGRDIGLQYLSQRGVSDEAIKKFHLGYALDKGSELTEAAGKAGFDLEVLKQLGLVGTSQQGRHYDRFRGRVIFPVFNSSGKVIAFGGRDLKGGPAKYINSPESELYKKSNELYGIYQARADIVKEDKCYLVEGYLDVIGMWQSGMRNTVASSGTALTDGQIALIHRFSENITLIYDGDPAGIKASLRGIDMLLSHKMKVKVLLLPDGDDPDSFARKHTPEEFREYVKANETDIIRFKASVLLNEMKGDPQSRINAINSVVESLAHIPDQVSRDVYIQECSRILSIPEETIAKSTARVRVGLIEKWKRDRARGEYGKADLSQTPQVGGNTADGPELERSDSGRSASQTAISDKTGSDLTEIKRKDAARLMPYERKVIKYCIKYAYLPIFYTDDTSSTAMNVIQYIDSELKSDDVAFTDSVFARIFDELLRLQDDFDSAYDKYCNELEQQIELKRREGIERISTFDYTVSEIEKAEQRLEQELDCFREAELIEFTKNFAAKELASHEESAVRNAVTDLLYEKHRLSHIYLKDKATFEREEDKLPVLLPRAVNEWKSEKFNIHLEEMFEKLAQAEKNGDKEQTHELQLKIAGLMRMRKEMAKIIGERIVSAYITKPNNGKR